MHGKKDVSKKGEKQGTEFRCFEVDNSPAAKRTHNAMCGIARKDQAAELINAARYSLLLHQEPPLLPFSFFNMCFSPKAEQIRLCVPTNVLFYLRHGPIQPVAS